MTDTAGNYTLSSVPVGTATVESFDANTNTAGSAQVNVASGQVATQDLRLAKGGSISGVVSDQNNQPVPGAQITVTASNGTFTATAASDGSYQIQQISPGNVQVLATDPVTKYRGQGSGSLGLSGQTLIVNVQIGPTGTVNGTVFRADGVTPVPGAQAGDQSRRLYR